MIERKKDLGNILQLIDDYSVVGILGARQVGKTTISRNIAGIMREKGVQVHFFDLENPEDLARMQDPMLAMKNLGGIIFLDEIQRKPEIFSSLRVLADRKEDSTKFVVLGSASPHLLRQSSESLAGRIAYYELGGFSISDIGIDDSDNLWQRGGFPKAYLAATDSKSFIWRRNFVRTFLERDLPSLGVNISSETMFRFWTMLAHYHGQIWNASEFGRSFGVADTTVRNYLDKLADCFMVRLLKPWHENISKRQVKSVKPFIRDSGIFHNLLGIRSMEDLERHPKCGASWEGFVIGELTSLFDLDDEDCYFWATHAGLELDLLVAKGSIKTGFEIKRTSSPKITPSMTNSIKDLGLERLYLIHCGDHSFDLADKIRAVAFSQILSEIKDI